MTEIIKQSGRFIVGELVTHKLLKYRAVIFDVDPQFSQSDDWYAEMAPSNPSKTQPWYHLLVHQAQKPAYVAEEFLQLDTVSSPIFHSKIYEYFSRFEYGQYHLKKRANWASSELFSIIQTSSYDRYQLIFATDERSILNKLNFTLSMIEYGKVPVIYSLLAV